MKTEFLNSLLSPVQLKYTEEPIEFQGRMVQSYVPVPEGSGRSAGEAQDAQIQPEKNADGDVYEKSSMARSSEDAQKAAEEKQMERQEEKEIRRLRDRDREVKAHEQAHKAAGGALASAPQYEYTRGPDGRQYAIAGSVQIDSNPVAGDPEATIRKMEKVQKAALAPVEPSSTDRKVAMEASRKEMQARMELRQAETQFMSDYQQQLNQSGERVNQSENSEAANQQSEFAAFIQPANESNTGNRFIPNSESVSANNLFGAQSQQSYAAASGSFATL